MSKFCTTCGFAQDDCKCDHSVTFDGLSYTNTDYSVPDSLVRQLLWVNREYPDALHAWDDITDAPETASNVRKAHFWTVCSIQTRTEVLDDIDASALGDFGTLKSAVETTYDGALKWEKVHDVWTGDVADAVASHARDGDWVDAVAGLIGLQRGGGTRKSENYTRVTKAHLITEILGDPDALCLDSARRDVLEPLFDRMFEDTPVRGPSTPLPQAEYRQQGPGVDADRVHPGSKEFLEQRLTRNPKEYRAITTEILNALTEATGMGRREVSHALFILGSQDGVTHHEPLAEMLD